MTDEKLTEALGLVGMMDFEKATEVEQRRIRAWVPLLPTLTDGAFLDLCVEVISAGVIAESQRSTEQESYIKAAACMRESARRHQAAGCKPDCRGDNLYRQAFSTVEERFGFIPSSSEACTCGSKAGE